MHDESDHIIVSDAEEGSRLDKILAERFQELKSRSYFQYLIEENKVFVNGKPAKKRFLPRAGDEIDIHFICSPEILLGAEPIPLDIIYEDEAIIVVNKPSGMVVHPAAGNWTGTFVNALLHHCQEIKKLSHFNASSHLRPGIVHRLDKETTGLLLAAKSDEAQRRLVEQFSKRQVIKEYRAICVGNPGNLTINKPIGRHPTQRKLMTVLTLGGGKEAISICKTLAYNSELSYVNIELITGRTHQIRVHLKDHKTPVLGDPTYGSDKANSSHQVDRQMLHARYLKIEHPLTGKMIEFQAPLPIEMEKILLKEKLFAPPI